MSNERKKCILLVRVSTLKQDFDEQEKELYQLAINDGYSDENIIAICEKESGIKLSAIIISFNLGITICSHLYFGFILPFT